jgi:anti-sigma-K factor RskA
MTALAWWSQTASRPSTPAGTIETLKLVQLTSMKPSDNAPEGYLCLTPDNETAMLWLSNLEPLDENHAYQIWLVRDGERTNAGLFRPASGRRTVVLITTSRPWKDYQDIGITVEPSQGSPGPTTPRIIGGKID